MSPKELIKFCKSGKLNHYTEHVDYRDACSNVSVIINIVKDGRKYTFHQSWGPSFGDFHRNDAIQYVKIDPTSLKMTWSDYVDDDGDNQLQFNF